MTVTRWWDPGVPMDLLTSGGDPALDHANRLIALHRVGAAALLSAAAVPLCDAETVADALEMTTAAAAVEIAKSDTDDPTAAANTAAALLYQACVNKGVIPPIAATRVAKVYGVPTVMLGRYPTLATDPRTAEAVLTDTADRALFSWVAAATTAETVAKAVETPDERRTAQADQPRAAGRYAQRPGVGAVTETSIDGVPLAQWLSEQLAAPEVGTPPAPEPTPAATRKKITSIRRISRITSATTPAATREAATRPAGTRRAGTRAALTRTAKRLIEEARAHGARINRPVPDPHTVYEPMPDAVDITTPGVVVLPLDEWERFQSAMPRTGTPGERAFPMGALNEYAHLSATARVDVAGSDSHKESIGYVADQIAAQPNRQGLPDPRVWELSAEEQHELDDAVQANNRGRRDRLLASFAANRLREVQRELDLDDRDLSVQRELGHVDWYVDADDEETVIGVWRPPLEWGDYTSHRPTTVLAEIVIETGYGQVDHGTRYSRTTNLYDPTTVVGTTDDPDPVMFYDRDRHVALYRTTATRLSPNAMKTAVSSHRVPGGEVKFTKAETPDTRRAAQAGQPRTAGRYAERDTSAAVTETSIDGMSINDWLQTQLAKPVVDDATLTPAPRKKISSIRRIGRIQPLTKPAETRQADVRAAGTQEAGLRRAATRFARSRRDAEPGRGELALHDGSTYHLVSTHAFKKETGIPNDQGHASLSPEARNWIDTSDTYDDEQVAVELFHRSILAKSKTEGEHWRGPSFERTYNVAARDEYGNNIGHEEAIEHVAAMLHTGFEDNPVLTAVEIEMKRIFVGSEEHIRVTVRGNVRQLPSQTLIRRGDVDPVAPMLLTWEGKRRTMNRQWIRNEVRSYWPLMDSTLPNPQSKATTFYMLNPWVETWLAHSPDEYLRDS